jgi:hypothetical protein
MNEKNLIKKLSPLKEVTPSSQRIRRMKDKIYHEIDGERKRTSSFTLYDTYLYLRHQQYGVFIVLALIIGVGIFYLPYTQNSIQPLIYSTRIALADNHYQKTKLAFEEAQMQFNSNESYQEVMATTGTTNQYISDLHLQGEKGKYTAQQCKKLYQEYMQYLSVLKNRLEQQGQPNYEAQISQYQEQAKSRFAYYKT